MQNAHEKCRNYLTTEFDVNDFHSCKKQGKVRPRKIITLNEPISSRRDRDGNNGSDISHSLLKQTNLVVLSCPLRGQKNGELWHVLSMAEVA